MSSILKVDTIQDQDGNNIINESANTITIGASGDTITIPSGATLANSGIITGFESTGIDDNATSTAITIDSAESLGLGTTSPFNSRPGSFTISNEAPTIYFEDTNSSSYGVGSFLYQDGNISWTVGSRSGTGTSGSSERMRIDSTGKVGINTSSPGSELHVVADDVSQSWSAYDGTVLTIENNDTDGCILQTVGRNTATNEIWFGDDDSRNIGRIRYEHSDDGLEFWTNNAERMRIDSSGNIGIGTASPAAQLHVYNYSGSTGFRITRGNNITGVGTHMLTDSARNYFNAYGDLVFGCSATGTGTSASERMRIDSSGNVGIGTSSPTAKLNVNGAIVGATKADSTPDNTDVSGVNSLTVSTGAGSQTINGLVGGVAGQVLHIIKTNSANTLTITHNNAGGTQKIFTSDTNSISLTNFGGVTLLFFNGNWYEVGK
jgi:hypothetical protein